MTNFTIDDFAQCPYVFDIWSVGSIVLEILSGFPLWLSLKGRVQSVDGRNIMNYGIFGVSGRDNTKILQKQQQILGAGINHMRSFLKKNYDAAGTSLLEHGAFLDLLSQMLDFDPGMRIPPGQALKEPFMHV